MGTHVTQGAGAKIKPAAPIEGVIYRMIRDILGHRPKIEVPIEPGGRYAPATHRAGEHLLHMAEGPGIAEGLGNCGRRRPGRARQPLWPEGHRSVSPNVHLVHRTNEARVDPLVDETGAFARMPLVSHLGYELWVGERALAQDARLMHGGRQRLLHIDVLTQIHRRLRD